MNKKALYESIMKEVSKQVKKAINENAPFRQKINGKNGLHYICTPEECKQLISSILCQSDVYYEHTPSLGECTEPVDITVTLNGVEGQLKGEATFKVDVIEEERLGIGLRNEQDYTPHVKLAGYNLTFYDENDIAYTIYLSIKDYDKMTNN